MSWCLSEHPRLRRDVFACGLLPCGVCLLPSKSDVLSEARRVSGSVVCDSVPKEVRPTSQASVWTPCTGTCECAQARGSVSGCVCAWSWSLYLWLCFWGVVVPCQGHHSRNECLYRQAAGTVTHEVFLRVALSRHVQSLKGSGQCHWPYSACLGWCHCSPWSVLVTTGLVCGVTPRLVSVWISLLLCPRTPSHRVPCVQILLAMLLTEGTLFSALGTHVADSRHVTVPPAPTCVAR